MQVNQAKKHIQHSPGLHRWSFQWSLPSESWTALTFPATTCDSAHRRPGGSREPGVQSRYWGSVIQTWLSAHRLASASPQSLSSYRVTQSLHHVSYFYNTWYIQNLQVNKNTFIRWDIPKAYKLSPWIQGPGQTSPRAMLYSH